MPTSARDPRPLRPRTIRPGRGAGRPVRPRTVGTLGRTEHAPLTADAPTRTVIPQVPSPTGDLGWDPGTGAIPILVDPDTDFDTDADDLTRRTDEHGIVDQALLTDPLLDRDEWADILTFTDEISRVDLDTAAGPPADTPTPTPDETAEDEHDAVAHASKPRQLLRNNLSVASGTALSRATGLIRSLLILRFLVGGLEDAYNNANNTPNQIYELILGGVLTATLVPLFTDDLEKKGKDRATSAIISTAVIALLAVSLLAFVAGPAIIFLLSKGSADYQRAHYLNIGTKLALLFAPQVFFYGLMAVWSAVLNARHRFLAAAWAPVLNNLVAITTLVVAWRYVGRNPNLTDAIDDPIVWLILGIGTTLGIALMALALYPSIRRSGVRVRFRPDFRHPAVQRAVRLSGWTFGYVIANLVAVNVIQFLAEPGSGGPTEYQTAFQFFQLPHGLLAVSIMVTFEPLLGRTDVRGDLAGFNRHLLLGYRLIGLLVIPAAVGYIALPSALDYRTFEAAGFVARFLDVSTIVAAFAAGLPGFSMYLYTMRAFYAMKNTRTPFFINVFQNALNIGTAIVFVRWWGVPGLALSYGLSYTVASAVAIIVLLRHRPGFDWKGLLDSLLRLLVAAVIMGGAVFGFVALLPLGSVPELLIATAAGVLVGGVVYAIAIIAIGVQGIDQLLRRLPGLRRFARD